MDKQDSLEKMIKELESNTYWKVKDIEKLLVLSGVRQFPVRVKCATLAWHTMDAALKGETEISTER